MSVENELGTTIEEELPLTELSEEDQREEDRARRSGWRPKEEYSGPADRWVDAKTFNERAERELPIMRERFKKLDSAFAKQELELTATKSQVTEANVRIKETTDVLLEVREMAKQAEDRAYNRAMRELKEQERRAVETSDVAAYDRIKYEQDQLARDRAVAPPARQPDPVVAPPAPVGPPANPVIDGWIADNPWFKSDAVLNVFAIDMDSAVQREHPEFSLIEKLNEVKRRTVDKFPEKFGNTRRAAPPAVLQSSAPAPRNKTKGVKDLPREFQEAFAKFKKQMPDYTEAEYLKMVGEV